MAICETLQHGQACCPARDTGKANTCKLAKCWMRICELLQQQPWLCHTLVAARQRRFCAGYLVHALLLLGARHGLRPSRCLGPRQENDTCHRVTVTGSALLKLRGERGMSPCGQSWVGRGSNWLEEGWMPERCICQHGHLSLCDI